MNKILPSDFETFSYRWKTELDKISENVQKMTICLSTNKKVPLTN